MQIMKRFSDVMEAFGFPLDKKRTDLEHNKHGNKHFDWYKGTPGGLFHIKGNPALPGTTEAIDKPLFDTVSVTNATTSIDCFTVPVGSANKTLIDTNMRASGQLPSPDKFIIQRIGINVMTAVLADLNLILNQVLFTFTVNSKVYTQARVAYYPCGFGVFGSTTLNATGPISNGFPGELGVRSMLYPIPLEPLDPFYGNLEMHGGATLGARAIGALANLSASTEVMVVLQGPYNRAI